MLYSEINPIFCLICYTNSFSQFVMHYRSDIEVLRGIAVLAVIAYHAFPHWFPGGYLGVDIFFVISGFLITHIILKESREGVFTLTGFYARRIRRLFPALSVVLGFCVLMGWMILFSQELTLLGSHVQWASVFSLNFVLAGEVGYSDTEIIYKPVMHLWSLAVEEQFYLIWPILLLLIRKESLLLALLTVMICTSFILTMMITNPDSAHFQTIYRVWQLGLGCLLAGLNWSPIFMRSKLIKNILTATCLSTIVFSVLVLRDDDQHRLILAGIPVLATAVILLCRPNLQRWQSIQAVGRISYPAYLWHWPLLSFTTIYCGGHIPTATVLICVALTFALAWLTFRYVEPVRHRRATTVPYLVGCVIAAGLTGLLIAAADGFPERTHFRYLTENLEEYQRTPRTDDECEEHISNYVTQPRLFQYCRSSLRENGPSVVLIGDSHAHALFPGFATVSNKQGYSAFLLASSSCPPFVGFRWGRNPEEKLICQKQINQMLSIVEADETIHQVLIVTRGPVYIHGEVEGKFTAQTVARSLQHRVDPPDMSYANFASGLSTTWQRLLASKHLSRVDYLLENHELDHHVKERIPRPFDYFNLSQQGRDMDKALYQLRMSLYTDAVELALPSDRRANILDSSDVLCNATTCRTFLNGRSLFADDDHLSVFGSHYVAERIQQSLFSKQ